MTADGKKIEELYHQALDKPKAERAAFLAEACGGDEALHRELASMLGALEKAGGFLELPALEHAARQAGQAGSQLLAGHQLGPFRIGALLGRGGMGEVYRAVDTRLDRQVALKLLPVEVAGNPGRLRRFTREAKAASSLNHPNIATIHEIGEAEGWHYIAMEYVEGDTLEARIRKQSLKLAEIIDLGIQAAEALEEAHAKGIIHRDIKPANIMLTPRGQVKVLDFGLAKRLHLEQSAQDMPGSTESYTVSGLIMGTVDYMSPEQVLGHEVDQRTDLFSLGVVLYDMVTGRLPFHGASPTETMDRILHAEPEAMARFNYDAPAELERMIRKCLEKDQNLRYQHASDLCTDLKRLKRDTESSRVATAVTVAETSGKSAKIDQTTRKWKWVLAGLLVILLAGVGVSWFARRRVQPQPSLELKETPLTTNPSEHGVSFGCISPDGKWLAYSGLKGMYLKLIETREERPIPQPEGSTAENGIWDAQWWFPDGTRFVAIRVDATGKCSAWVVSVLSGWPRLLRDNAAPGPPSPDGSQIVFSANLNRDATASELWLMGAQGENPRKFLTAAEGDSLDYPVWSPDGLRIAYKRYHGSGASLESRNLNGEQLTTIFFDPRFEPIMGFWWFPDGRLIFTVREWGPEPNQEYCRLFEVKVNPKTGRPLSPPRLITRWAGIEAVVLNGTADGRRLAVLKGSLQTDVFVGDLEAGGRRLKIPRRLTRNERTDYPSAWTKDGKAVFFHSDRNGQFDIFKQAVNQETAELIVTGPGNKHDPVLSTDGSWILYLQDVAGAKTQIRRVPASGGAPEMVLEGSGIKGLKCSWSPATLCVLGEESPDQKQCIFAEFDPMKGRGRELARVTLKQSVQKYFWDLSRDGSRLAFAQELRGSERRIQILPLSGGEAREVTIKREIQMSSLDWAIDGGGFFVGTITPGGMLFFVDLDGHTQVLWKTATLWGGFGPRGLPSPDGRYLAMLGWTIDSNVWMIENF